MARILFLVSSAHPAQETVASARVARDRVLDATRVR